jgi:hypothetical protein
LPALSHPEALPRSWSKRGGHESAVATSNETVQQLAKKRERYEQIGPSWKFEQERSTEAQGAQHRHHDEPGSAAQAQVNDRGIQEVEKRGDHCRGGKPSNALD